MKWLILFGIGVVSLGCDCLMPPHTIRVTLYKSIVDTERHDRAITEVIASQEVEVTDRQYRKMFGSQ